MRSASAGFFRGAEQRADAREVLGSKSHREFQLVIPLEDVRDFRAATIIGKRDRPAQQGPQSLARHREIAAVQEACTERVSVADAALRVTPAPWDIPCARVAVEVRPLREHLGEDVEILRVSEAALRRGVRGDDGHAAFEREREHAGIGVRGIHDLHRVLAAGVREQRQSRRRPGA